LEVRTLDVGYDRAYRAATQAFFSLGYSIGHSDKVSGILGGSRMTGVAEAKKDQEARAAAMGAMGALSMIPYVGVFGSLGALFYGSGGKEPVALDVTMFLQAKGENQTEIRFKMQANGEPVWDPVVIDSLWVTTQREAMIE
jgi:hypothetical protein